MDMLWTSLLMGMVALVSGVELGVSHEGDWAYQWYPDEPFSFECQKAMLINSNQYVTWGPIPMVETHMELKNGTVNNYYEVRSKGGVGGAELYVKKVLPEVHGVYVCNVYNEDTTPYNKTIFALNLRDQRYRVLGDKYKHNVVVAVISTAVFLVPLITLCILHRFRWEARNPEEAVKRKYAYADGTSLEGNGAYMNPAFNTQL